MASKAKKNPFEEYTIHAVNNEIEIVASKKCGCFFCRSIYDARKVSDWISDERGVSALCPECGMDAVIGDASGIPLDKPLLKEMNLACFGMDYMERNPGAVLAYVQRYVSEKITHKPYNEKLFLKYLTMLADSGDPTATLALGKFYELGGDFLPKDPEKAVECYRRPCIKENDRALCSLGRLYEAGYGTERLFGKKAFECYAKAAALGSLEAVYCMSDCYLNGIFVEPDAHFALTLLEDGFAEVAYDALHERKGWDIFPQFAVRLARLYDRGVGVNEPDAVTALRYYLLASLGLNVDSALSGHDPEPALSKEVNEEIQRIGKIYHLQAGEPVFDGDTFYDTFGDSLNSEHSTKTIELISYDPKERNAIVEITYNLPPIVLDLGNLYAGFAPTKVRWNFQGLSSVKTSSIKEFDSLEYLSDDGWKFTKADEDGNPIGVFEIRYASKEPLKLKTVTPKKAQKRVRAKKKDGKE